MFFETTGNEYIMKQLRKETTGHGHELSPKTGLRVSFEPNASSGPDVMQNIHGMSIHP